MLLLPPTPFPEKGWDEGGEIYARGLMTKENCEILETANLERKGCPNDRNKLNWTCFIILTVKDHD
jgi:hypothetical protein